MTSQVRGPVHCLSFDVEEHFQVSAFWSEARRQQWDRLESRVYKNTKHCLHCWLKGTSVPHFLYWVGWQNDVRKLFEALRRRGMRWLRMATDTN